MAYTDAKPMTAGRMWSIVVVVAIHAAILWALVNGGYNVAKKALSDLKVIDIKEAPPPPEDLPPPPPPDKNLPPPPVVSPPPIVQTQQVVTPQVTTQATPPPVFTPTPEPPRPAPPPPPPPPPVQALAPKGNPASWTSNDDYPPSAIRNEEAGTTGFRLDIGADGKVTNCTVTSSSGSSALDTTTCTLLKRRAKFAPARDSAGNATGGFYNGRIRWVLPTD